MRKFLIGLMAMMLALPALAQKAPEGIPERDAVITFRATRGAEVMMEWTLALSAGGRLRRIDMAGVSTSVVDIQTGAGFQVMNIPGQSQPMVMDIPPESKQSPMDELVDEQKLRFTSKGSDKVIGIDCEKTEARDEKGLAVICCRTERWFGLNLRAEGNDEGQPIRIEAVKIEFAPQDPARFRRPAGMAMPQMPSMPPTGRSR